MPRFTDDMSTNIIQGTNFQYSAVKLEHLGATEYTLVTIVNDVSGSVAKYKKEMENCLKEIITACRRSPRSDNLMIRFLTFNEKGEEIHGYKLLTDCNPDDYNNSLKVGGMTALYDACYNAFKATESYGKVLTDNDFDVNGITFIITDGADNSSTMTENSVNDAIKGIMQNEFLESFVSVLIGVDIDPRVDQYLKDFHTNAGLTQYINLGDANEKKLAKLAEFVSKSISSQSSSLGTGKASNQTSLTI